MERFSPRTQGKEWCEQCEVLQAPGAVRACRSTFCKLKALLPPDQTVGFEAAKPCPPPVDVAPAIVARVERAREAPPPEKEPAMEAPPVRKREYVRRDADGMTPRTRALLEAMKKRAESDGTVKVSFNDLFEEIGCTKPSTVSPLMQTLVNLRLVTVVSRPGGKKKSIYLINALKQDKPLEVPAGEPIEQRVVDDDTPIQRAEMPADPQKSPREACGSCRFAHIVGIGSMRCRRLPPHAKAGHPVIKPGDWCGEFQESA